MQFGFTLKPEHDVTRHLALTNQAEEGGFAHRWLFDSHVPQLVDAGNTDPYYHGVARDPVFEGEATNRVIRLAEAAGVPVSIVHLSARDALNEVREARDRGTKAFAEHVRSTCSSRSTTSATGSKARSSSARRRSAPPTTRPSCGSGS